MNNEIFALVDHRIAFEICYNFHSFPLNIKNIILLLFLFNQ